jgi:hypothetical protein
MNCINQGWFPLVRMAGNIRCNRLATSSLTASPLETAFSRLKVTRPVVPQRAGHCALEGWSESAPEDRRKLEHQD